MAAFQARALTSHRGARDTGEGQRGGRMPRKHLLLGYNYFPTALLRCI